MRVLKDVEYETIRVEVQILGETVETHLVTCYDIEHEYDMIMLCRYIAKKLHGVLKVLVQIEILGLKVTQGDKVIFETLEDYEMYLHEHDIVLRNHMIYVKGELYTADPED